MPEDTNLLGGIQGVLKGFGANPKMIKNVILVILTGCSIIIAVGFALRMISGIYSPLEERAYPDGSVVSNVLTDSTAQLEITYYIVGAVGLLAFLMLISGRIRFITVLILIILIVVFGGHVVVWILQIILNLVPANKTISQGAKENNPANDLCICFWEDFINDGDNLFTWESCPNLQLPDCNIGTHPLPGDPRFDACKATVEPCIKVSDYGQEELRIYWAWWMRFIADIAIAVVLLVAIIAVGVMILTESADATEAIVKSLITIDQQIGGSVEQQQLLGPNRFDFDADDYNCTQNYIPEDTESFKHR